MSYKKSNLYASRVFSEHPLAMWAMDENINFISLVAESAKQVNSSDWTLDNLSVSTSFTPPAENPIEQSDIGYIYKTSSSAMAQASLDPIVYSEKIDVLRGSICFNIFLYKPTAVILESIDIGLIIGGQEYFKTYSSINSDRWEKLQFTKDIETSDNIQPFIRINYSNTSVYGEESSGLFMSGISVGQWSEPFNSFDTGTQPVVIPTEISSLINVPSSSLMGIEIDPYGFNDGDTAYAIEYGNILLAETSGMPMVYGSKCNVSVLQFNSFYSTVDGGSSSTITFEELIEGGSSSSSYTLGVDGGQYSSIQEGVVPSLVFPGKGFLNQSGKYSNLTVEFWLRVNNESIEQLKIFGPLSSTDGIYIGNEFITVKVGKYVKSYFVGQWYRPMLVHFGQTESEIYLMINGERVISITIDSLDIPTFPPANEDYLGFFGHKKILPFEIDIFSIFPYIITEQIAKRRFVYGQGVESQESIVSSVGGDLTYVDFPFSNYSSTISYPDRTPWTNGYSNNLNVDSNGISLPELTLPEIVFVNNNEDISQGEAGLVWENYESDNFSIQNEDHTFISMLPNENYSDIESTIYFSKLNKTGSQTKSIYSVLKTSSDISSEQSVLYISNNTSLNYFEVKIISGSIQYIYNDEILNSLSISSSSEFVVGFNMDRISESHPQLSSFFSNLDNTSLNFAGAKGNTFLGKVFSLTINNKFFTEKDTQLFDNNGFAQSVLDRYSYVGSYTLIPKQSNSTVYLDIAATGYWEASIPLTYFGKYVTSKNGSRFYDLDLIQFNIDIPSTLYSRDTEDSALYHEHMSAFSYATLQRKEVVGTIPYTSYTNSVEVGNSRILDFDNETNLDTTKFEICDSTIIFPPKSGVDFKDYYITMHILIKSNGINTENITIKNMSFSSLAFDEAKFYSIGTPTGRAIYPVSKIDDNYIYKTKIPVAIEDESSPYLYLSGDSGISLLPEDSLNMTKALSFPINETLRSDFKMVGLQMYLMFNEYDEFPQEKLVAKFFNNVSEYLVYLTPELDMKRGKVRLVDADTGIEVEDVIFFLNGKEVSHPYINPFKWSSIVISLQDRGMLFNGVSGQLEVYSGVRVDNVAIFSDINEIKISLITTDDWYDLSSVLPTWGSASTSVWSELLNEETSSVTVLSVDGENIFNTYSGLSYAVGDDNSTINVNFDSISVLNDAEWTTFEYRPI